MIDLGRLRALHAVALYGSVNRAAEVLGYTPSAVSQQLAKLERETRTTLVERQGRGIVLTDAARQLATTAGRILELVEDAELTLEEQRRRLVEEPALLATATEEFLRFFSVNESLTSTVTRDAEVGGQQLHRGDHLMLSWLSANRDATVFERPDDVVLDRAPNPHLAFGLGPHRCIGMHLARTMFRVLVREVLTRIPDYVVDRDGTELYDGNPELNGVVRLPATFTPGPRVGPATRPF